MLFGSLSSEGLSKKTKSPSDAPNRPDDSDFNQMRLKTIPADFRPIYIGAILLLLAIFFIPTGVTLASQNEGVYEQIYTYDSDPDSDCAISEMNQGKQCQIKFYINEDFEGPLYLYYKLTNFFQNHQRYYQSRSIDQLQGTNMEESDVELDCNPLYKNGSMLLNPCGLIANSFFTDIITLDSNSSVPSNQFTLDESGISLKADRDELYKQVDGFKYRETTSTNCVANDLPADCKSYTDSKTGKSYLYYYPDEDSVQYLYESYPDQISPIDGVTDEHFIVWMRVAALPTFRKLYGKIDGSFKSGDVLVFNVTANYEVDSYDATKSLLLTDLGDYGGKNIFMGQVYITIGVLCLFFGLGLLLKGFLDKKKTV